MDPEANETEQICLARQILGIIDKAESWDRVLTVDEMEAISIEAARLAELVIALSEWKEKTQ